MKQYTYVVNSVSGSWNVICLFNSSSMHHAVIWLISWILSFLTHSIVKFCIHLCSKYASSSTQRHTTKMWQFYAMLCNLQKCVTCWQDAGVVICLEGGANLHMAQLMPLPLTVFCFSKIQTGFTFLVPAHPGSPGKRAIKRVCVCWQRHVCKTTS